MLYKRVKGILKQVLKCMFLFGLIVILEANQAAAVNTSVTAKKNTTTPKTVTCEKTVIKVTLDGAYTGAKKQGSDPSWLTTTGSGSSYTVTVNALGSASARSTTITFLETRGSETIHWYLKIEQKNHNWGVEWVTDEAATCSKTGSKHRVCNACGRRETGTIPKDSSNHAAWGSWKTTPATCTATGTKKRTCGCGNKTETQTIPVDSSNHGNNGTKTKTVDATCTKDGYTVNVCKGCGAERGSRTKIPALGHTWGNWTTDTEPGCETPGTKHRNCTRCNEREDGTIKALEHLYEGKVKTVPATCTTDGYSVVQCSRCGKEEGTKTVIKAGHKWGTWNIIDDAGCETPGTKYRTCTRCNAREDGKIDPKGHLVEGQRITVDATCTKEGYWVAKCSRCGAPQGQKTIIPAKGHAWEVWVTDTPVGCETEGKKHRVCSRCKKTETEIIKPNGHVFEGQLKTVPAGCTKEGYTVVKCTNCDKEAEGRTILPALGHDWSEWVFNHDETCYEDGTKYRTCTRCGTREDGTVPKKEHKENSQPKVVAATCVSDGYRVITCIHCGKEMTERTILKKTGIHDFGAWVTTKEAECKEEGSKYRKCINCPETEVITLSELGHLVLGQRREVVPPGGGIGILTLVCSRCGKPVGNDAIFDVPEPTEAPKATVEFIIRDNDTNEDVEGKTIEVTCGQEMGNVFPKVKNPKKKTIVAWVDEYGKYYNQHTILTSTNRVILSPKWCTLDHYTIILHGNGAQTGVTQYIDVPYGKEYTLPSIKELFDDGVGFEGWGTAPDGGDQIFSDLCTRTDFAGSASSITLYALWNSSCTVTYHDIIHGTTITETLTHRYKVKSLVELPQFKIPGLEFVEWSKIKEPSPATGLRKGMECTPGKEYYADGNNWNLYPVYKSDRADKFAVVFYDTKQNGGGLAVQYFSRSLRTIEFSQVFPTYDERYFLEGWTPHPGFTNALNVGVFDKSDGRIEYKVGNSASLAGIWTCSYVVLDSVWKRSVPVELRLNYGYDNKVDKKSVDVDEYILPKLERKGYTFCGWRENPDDPETDVGETYSVPDQGADLYAVWEPIVYTIEYYDGLTGEKIGLSEKVTINDSIKSSAANINGLKWCGWATGILVPYNAYEATLILEKRSKYNFKVLSQGSKVSELPLDERKINLFSFYTVDGDIRGKTLVVYHPGNGNQTRNAVWLSGASLVQMPYLENNVKGGTFSGWKRNKQEYKPGEIVKIDGTQANMQLVVFVANWQANHKITLDPNYPGAAKVDLTDKYLTNSKIGTKDLIIGDRKGYTLVGWEAVQKNYCRPYGLDDEIFIPNEDLTLLAIWRKNEYKVVYHSGFNSYVGCESDMCERTTLLFDEKRLNWLKKPGYIFVGWTLEDPHEQPWAVPESKIITIQNNKEIVLDEDLHVYSCYKVDPTWSTETRILFTYNWMGGTDGPEDEYFDPLQNNYHVSKVIPKKEGYYFEGWTLKEYLGENIFIDDRNCAKCVDKAKGYVELYASWKPKVQNNMMGYFQSIYGRNKMPDYYFLTEYESPEWVRVNDYCYFAIKTTRINSSEHFQEFDSLVLVVEYKNGMWVLTGRSASDDWREALEYEILIRNKDDSVRVKKFASDAAITLLSEHPVFKYFVMGLDIGTLCAEVSNATKQDGTREIATVRLLSKISDVIYASFVKEFKDTKLASDLVMEMRPFLYDSIKDCLKDSGWSIVVNTIDLIGKAASAGLDHPEEVLKILEAADKKIDAKILNKLIENKKVFYEKVSNLTSEDAEILSTKVGLAFDACSLIVSSIIDNVGYSKAAKKQMDPFGEMNIALSTFYNQIDGLQFGKAIKDGFPVVIQKIYDSYCKLIK